MNLGSVAFGRVLVKAEAVGLVIIGQMVKTVVVKMIRCQLLPSESNGRTRGPRQ